MTTVSATELQNNFGKYLQYVQTGNDVIILRNGKEVARLISRDKSVSFLTDSLLGDDAYFCQYHCLPVCRIQRKGMFPYGQSRL